MEEKITMELTQDEVDVINNIREKRALDKAQQKLAEHIVCEASLLLGMINAGKATKHISTCGFNFTVVGSLAISKEHMHAAVLEIIEIAEKHAKDIRENGDTFNG